MKIVKRLIYIVQAPLFFLYVSLPFLWVLDLPYWVFTGRSLMDDWCEYNEV
jgi:hypothetical protein